MPAESQRMDLGGGHEVLVGTDSGGIRIWNELSPCSGAAVVEFSYTSGEELANGV